MSASVSLTDRLQARLRELDEIKERIFKCGKGIIENCDAEERESSLADLHEKLTELEGDYKRAVKSKYALENVRAKIAEMPLRSRIDLDFSAMYEEALKFIPDPRPLELVKEFDELLSDSNLDESDLVCDSLASASSQLDPWTKLPIKFAVRSKDCNHVYDRDSLEKQLSKIKKNRKLGCPYIGCVHVITRDKIFYIE